jgi:hypothetical protein
MRRIAVIPSAQIIRGTRFSPKVRELRPTSIVVKKLILPIIEEIPARCSLKIAKSTEIPL